MFFFCMPRGHIAYGPVSIGVSTISGGMPLLFTLPLLVLAATPGRGDHCSTHLYRDHGTEGQKYKALAASNISTCCVLCQQDERCGHFGAATCNWLYACAHARA